MNDFYFWDFYSCALIVLSTFNETIEGWVWIWQYSPKYVVNISLMEFSFINDDRVIWLHVIKKVFYIIVKLIKGFIF